MKFIKIIFTGLLAMSLLGCKKFLDVQPKDYASDETTIFDKNSSETALAGAYRDLASDAYYGQKFQFIIYLQGGDLAWGDARTVNREFIQNKVRSDNEEVNNVWIAIYKTINQANHIIEKVPGVVDATLTPVNRERIIGEAYFIRALSYFDLARTWGGVPIILKPTVNANDTRGVLRSSLNETYAQVLNDLIEAEKRLVESTNRIRVSKKTVWALRARYHLYRKEWADAESYATLLINDATNYTLMKPFPTWFANNVIGTKESILETSYSSAILNTHRNSWQPTTNSGIRSWYPDDEFVTLITDPLIGGTRRAFVAQTTSGNPLLWYGNLYYRSPAIDPSYILRIAEQYLIRAEARAQQSNFAGALEDLNLIRDRAALGVSAAVTKDEILQAILDERRFELPFEPHRWFDVVRFDKAEEELGIPDAESFRYVLPIPNPQIIIDPTLAQNPGY